MPPMAIGAQVTLPRGGVTHVGIHRPPFEEIYGSSGVHTKENNILP
jgi:hypothetical protein